MLVCMYFFYPTLTTSVVCPCVVLRRPVVWEVVSNQSPPLLPHPNNVLCLCSCAGAPDGEVDKLFLDKLPGADGMRVVTVDGLICLAAIDFTVAVCATTAHEAAAKLSKLSCHERDGAYVSKLLSRKHQFPGAGQRPIAVITFSEAIKLLCYLPRMHTGAMMDYVVDTFTRLVAGDARLLQELTHNAQSDGLAQTAARNELGVAKAQNSIELASASGQVELSGAHKRKWLELDVAERETKVVAVANANARAALAHIERTFSAIRRASGGALSAAEREAHRGALLKLVGVEPEAPGAPRHGGPQKATPLAQWLTHLCGKSAGPRGGNVHAEYERVDAAVLFGLYRAWVGARYPDDVEFLRGPQFGKDLKGLCCMGGPVPTNTSRFSKGGLVYLKGGGSTTYGLRFHELAEHLKANGMWAANQN